MPGSSAPSRRASFSVLVPDHRREREPGARRWALAPPAHRDSSQPSASSTAARSVSRAPRRGLPEAPLGRLEQPLGDGPQGPRVGRLEELADRRVPHVGLGHPLVHPVLDHPGGGVVAEQVVDGGRHLERALVAVALHGGDPLRVDHPGADHPGRLLGQTSGPGAGPGRRSRRTRPWAARPVSARTVATIPPWSWR